LSVQEFGTYLQTASALNGDAISEFISLIRNQIIEYIDGLSKENKITFFENLYGSKNLGQFWADDIMRNTAIEGLVP
jgi:hypothetical protein